MIVEYSTTPRIRGDDGIYELVGSPYLTDVNEQGRVSEHWLSFSFAVRVAALALALTKVQYLDRLEESVLAAEILHRPFAAVVLDVRETAGPKHVVIAVARGPIEVRHSALIVHHVDVADEVRGPGGLAGLQ